MKKLLIIPALLLSTGLFFLSSCGNSDTNNAMRSPSQNKTDSTTQKENKANKEGDEKGEKENEKGEKESIATQTKMVTGTDAKSKNIENMQAAFKGETTASAKYAAYSKKAEQEGYHQIALLFKAASASENIHANNHKSVMQESGITVPVIKPEYNVKTTKENLQDAIAGETYEVTNMYPEFITAANEAGDQMALISLNYAYKTEKKHKAFYEAALTALQNNTVKLLPAVYYVCPTCGNTYENAAPARCGISMTNGNKFIKITSL
jgi:rubrerythrin